MLRSVEMSVTEEVPPSLPRAERREQLHELVREFSWCSFAIFFFPVFKTYTPLNERSGFYIGLI